MPSEARRAHGPGSPVATVALVTELTRDEDVRVRQLLDAQAKAADLFRAVEEGGLIAPGVRETAASDAIRDLAADMFGVSRYWHKRIVRAGPNTLQPYRQNPPDRVIGEDDIAFCDFGRCHWILEIHLVDRGRQIGGFHEELLDLGS